MTDAHQPLQHIIEFCSDKWTEADRAPDQTPDMKTGRKMAYNDVLQQARRMLADAGRN